MEKVDILKRLASVPKEERVSSFFRDLGVDFFIDGCTVGMQGVDWDQISLEDLDNLILVNKWHEGYHLRRTETSARQLNVEENVHGLTAVILPGGFIGNPAVEKDGVRFVFTFASFRDSKFWLKVKKITKGQEKEGEFTVVELRKIFLG